MGACMRQVDRAAENMAELVGQRHRRERMVHHAQQQTAEGLAGTPRTLSAAEHQDIED